MKGKGREVCVCACVWHVCASGGEVEVCVSCAP